MNKTRRNIFATYFSDNDLRRPNGLLYYRFTTDQSDLSKAKQIINQQGFLSFNPEYCIVSTWENVKYFVINDRDNLNLQQENTYQLILCSDGQDTQPIYQYYKIEWSRSEVNSNHATVIFLIFSFVSGECIN